MAVLLPGSPPWAACLLPHGIASMDDAWDDAALAGQLRLLRQHRQGHISGAPTALAGKRSATQRCLGRSRSRRSTADTRAAAPAEAAASSAAAGQTTLGVSAQLAPTTRLSSRPQPRQGPKPRVPRRPRRPHLRFPPLGGATMKPLPLEAARARAAATGMGVDAGGMQNDWQCWHRA